MGRIATDINTQIDKLKNRGMILDFDEPKIKEILLDIGYYRLGFYWCPFEIGLDHKFKESLYFSDVIKLYYLDVDLRNTLIKSINRIEISFRTKLVYYVSNKYKDYSTWFANPEVVNQALIRKIEELYSINFINKNKPIKAHHKKYINDKYAPAWKTLEYLTFGTIVNIYRNLKNEDIKSRVSESFGILNPAKFVNLLETIVLLRNICAHGDVLFDFRTPKGISVVPSIEFNNKDRSSLDSCIKVVSYFLGQISVNRKSELDGHVKELFDSFKGNVNLRQIVENKINYKY